MGRGRGRPRKENKLIVVAWRVDRQIYERLRVKYGKKLAEVLRSVMMQLTGE